MQLLKFDVRKLSMPLIQCPKCKNDIDDTSQYCSICGHKLVHEKVEINPPQKKQRHLPQCPNCKRDVAYTSESCPYCGHKLIPQKPPEEKQIIECPNCKRNIISTAEKCPYCKFRLRKKTVEEEDEKEEEETKNKIIGAVKVIALVGIIFIIAYIFSSKQSGDNTPSKTTTKSNESTFSNKYVVNADVIFAATNEPNFNTMLNCIVSKDQEAIGKMVLYGQVKYLYRNNVVYLVTPKFKYYIVRPEGSNEMLYVVGEQLTRQ
jgi:hypothetical protein